mgnify:CR=1 FL=1
MIKNNNLLRFVKVLFIFLFFSSFVNSVFFRPILHYILNSSTISTYLEQSENLMDMDNYFETIFTSGYNYI